jgi:hypothetical protein
MLWSIESSMSTSGVSDATVPTDCVESRDEALETRGFLVRPLPFFPGGWANTKNEQSEERR